MKKFIGLACIVALSGIGGTLVNAESKANITSGDNPKSPVR